MVTTTYIKDGKQIVALVVKRTKKIHKKVDFITENKKEMQVAMMNRPAKEIVRAHYHPEQKRIVKNTSEFLYIVKGNIRVTFYKPKKKIEKITTKELSTGDFLCFFNCGHSIEFLKKTSLIEVKQGPFKKSFDKIFLNI
tara:strand:- start:209 stop:625 length:417 start_codon:yes stop_codon:yes gene_type:complete